MLLLGILLVFAGAALFAFCAWFGALLTYGFGDLIMTNRAIKEELNTFSVREQLKKDKTAEHE